jgi:threonine/homoserine/homoserine lactone efflux protein
MVSLEFLLTALVVVLIPGTGVIYTISVALMQGRRASFWASLGCTLGIVPHLLATAMGLAAVMHTSALAFALLKWAGVAYLLYVAWATWRDRSAFAVSAAAKPVPRLSIVSQGIWLNLLNPKLTLFFLAFLPQFVPAGAAHPMQRFLVLSAVFMGLTLLVFMAYGWLAHAFRRRVIESRRVQDGLRHAFSAAFAGLGIKLALGDR